MNALAVLLFFALSNPDLQKVHTVYLLSMSNSMDQYLANRLTTEGVLQVVTDPNLADAVLTDRLGLGFEERLKQLYPPPVPPPPPRAESDKEKEKDKDKDGKKDLSDALKADEAVQRNIMGSRPTRGNFFLVDRRTKQVVWSVYSPSKDSSARQLSNTAVKVVDHLKKDLNPEVKP
jgi:hypothetical protein